ncbi:MAG: hypothetical protein ACX939_04555 [Hyphococcus sp.]
MTGSALLAARAVFALLLVAVTWLTLTTNPDNTEPGFAVMRWIAELVFGDARYEDKFAHFTAYGALGVSAFWARLGPRRARYAPPVALALYGALLEGLQGLGGVRAAEFTDGAANALGAAVGFVAAAMLARAVAGKPA